MGDPQRPADQNVSNDGWAAFSLLLAGVIVYGGAGWLLDRWLGWTFFVPVGMLGGLAGALYLVYTRFWR